MGQRATISSGEKRIFLLLMTVVLLLITAPYLWVASHAPPGTVFSGVLETVEDQNLHLSWCKQAADGHFFLHNLFNADPEAKAQAPLLIHLLWWVVGGVSTILHVPLVVIYQFSRLLFTCLALWWYFQLCCYLSPRKRVRLTSVALAGFSSGVGWIDAFVPSLQGHFMDQPGNSMKSEAFIFHSALFFPHVILPLGCMALTYLSLLRAQESGRFRHVAIASVAAFLLANTHTYGAPVMAIVLVCWAIVCVVQKRRHREARTSDDATAPKKTGFYQRHVSWLAPCVVCIALTVPALYQWIIFRHTEYRSAIDSAVILAPTPLNLLVGYGFVGVLALAGMWQQRREHASQLMLVWVAVTTVMMYTPLPLAGRMIEGLQWPLCFFAAVALCGATARLRTGAVRVGAIALFVGVTAISSVRFAVYVEQQAFTDWATLFHGARSPVFLTADEADALRYLNTAIPVEQRAATTVFSLPMIGNYVPRFCGTRVFVGHWSATQFFDQKTQFSSQVFAGSVPAHAVRVFFKDYSIGYVLVARCENLCLNASGFKIPLKEWGVKKVWQQGEVSIYRVENS